MFTSKNHITIQNISSKVACFVTYRDSTNCVITNNLFILYLYILYIRVQQCLFFCNLGRYFTFS